MTFKDNYLESQFYIPITLGHRCVDTGQGTGGCSITLSNNFISNSSNAAIYISAASQIWSKGNMFLGAALWYGGCAIIGAFNAQISSEDYTSSLYLFDYFSGGARSMQFSGWGLGVGQLRGGAQASSGGGQAEAALDLGSAMATRSLSIPCANGANNDVSLGNPYATGIWSPTGWAYLYTPTAAYSITGFQNGPTDVYPSAPLADGQTLFVFNSEAYPCTLKHNDSGSGATHRITSPTGFDVVIPAGGWAMLMYDKLRTATWRIVHAPELHGSLAEQTLVSASAATAWDGSVYNNANLSLVAESTTLGAMSHARVGQTYTIHILGSSGKTITFNGVYDFGTIGNPASPADTKVLSVSMYCNATNHFRCVAALGFSS